MRRNMNIDRRIINCRPPCSLPRSAMLLGHHQLQPFTMLVADCKRMQRGYLDHLQQQRRSASANARYEAKRETGTVSCAELRSSSLAHPLLHSGRPLAPAAPRKPLLQPSSSVNEQDRRPASASGRLRPAPPPHGHVLCTAGDGAGGAARRRPRKSTRRTRRIWAGGGKREVTAGRICAPW
jgi:hypothetical protein